MSPNIQDILNGTMQDLMENRKGVSVNRSHQPVDRLNGVSDDRVGESVQIGQLCMAAEHTSCTADELAVWAKDAVTSEEEAVRWQAVAVTRNLACAKWSEATRRLHNQLSGTV